MRGSKRVPTQVETNILSIQNTKNKWKKVKKSDKIVADLVKRNPKFNLNNFVIRIDRFNQNEYNVANNLQDSSTDEEIENY